jgi:CRISPR-associated protein Cst2
MLKYVTFAVKVQLNVHDLNNEAVAGDVQDIRMMEFLDEDGKRQEAPAVSGRMLKHWHYEAMRELGLEEELPFCDACRMGEPVRPSLIVDDNGTKKLSHREGIKKGTNGIVSSCIVCDVHGYLAAIAGGQRGGGETAEEERAVSERRSSRVMFSWLMPVLDSECGTKQVIHSRVKSGMNFKEAALKSQMPYYKSYASGTYAFVSALDIERIGLVELNLGTNSPHAVKAVEERRKRAKVSIEAYRYLISGRVGASLSHAIPHTRPIEVLAAYSEVSPIPFPISPIYKNYIQEYKGLTPKGTTILFWSQKNKKIEGVTIKSTINEIFDEIIGKIDTISEEK